MTKRRWFRWLLRLLPADFRADYGQEMERVFEEERREAGSGGFMAGLPLWWRTVRDLLAIGPQEHLVQLRQDVRYALKGMRRNPGLVGVVILTLALGIGANTAIFSVVHAVLLRPLPYDDSARLVAVWNRWDGSPVAALSDPEFLDYSEQSRTMAMAASAGRAVNVGGTTGDPERVAAAAMTVNALDVLGVGPAMGRWFLASDEMPGAPNVAILSDRFWRDRFGADPGIVGRPITIDSVPTEVVGVTRPDLVLPIELGSANPVDVIVPLVMDRAAPRNRRGGHYLQAFARLKPGVSIEQASVEMDAILAPLARAYPDEHDQGNFGIVVRSLREDRLGGSRQVLAILSSAVALVLLLACANVANLMLARGEARRRELAVRTALGADRFRIVRQLLTESCVLSLAGAAAGLLFARGCQRVILTAGNAWLPRIGDVQLSAPVLVFTTGLAGVAGVLFGIVPALQVSRDLAQESLNEGGRSSSGRGRLRQVLVVCQVACASVLLVAAGLLIKSFARVVQVPSGVVADRVLTMRVTLPASRYPTRAEVTAGFDQLLTRVRALPGVRLAGAASGLPLAVGSGDWSFDVEGRARIGTRYPGAADWYTVTPGYFEALSIPLTRGRLPAESDTSAAPPVVFVNEATARALFANADPIGQRIRFSRGRGDEQPWRTIVGIVGDVRHRGLDSPARTEIFIPYEQFVHFSPGSQQRSMSVAIKTAPDPASLASAVRGALRSVDPEIPAAQMRDMSTVIARSLTDRRLNATLIGTFGVLALVLAIVGLYGVMAYAVTRRTREVGIRIALGASSASVLALVVGEGLKVAALGIVLGLAIATAAGGSLVTLLYDVGPRDVSDLALAAAVLLLTSALASYVPARRATQVDPGMALRSD